jgi:pyruvate dehydrogenase phosphatase regulatory subunit
MKSDIPFIGREALQRQLDEGVRKLFVMLQLDNVDHNSDLDPWPWGGEPIYRDGVLVGNVTTTSYGFSLGKQICLGFVHDRCPSTGERKIVTPEFVKTGIFEVDIAGIMYPATVRLNPPVLPKKVKMEGDDRGFQTTRHSAV